MSYFLLFFPAFDVISSYPLAVLVMKDNLFMAITGKDAATLDEDPQLKRKQQVLRLVLSVCISVLPLTGSFFVANLVDITRYAGLIGFAKCFFYPALLQLKSQYDCNKVFFEAVKQAQSEATKSASMSINDETVPLISDKNKEFPQVQYLQWNNPTYTTSYQTIFSHPIMVVVLSLFSIVAFGLAVASLPVRVHKSD